MPAHFTSGNGRSQTFLLKCDVLSTEVEYEMASQAWHNQPEGVSNFYKWDCVKIGEDIYAGLLSIHVNGSDAAQPQIEQL